MYAKPARRVRGFTLLEMVVFIVIVSVALAGVMTVLNLTSQGSADPIQPKQAMLVAEAMLEEIQLKPYNNPSGGYSGADRAQFDDIVDYSGYTSTGVYSLDNLATPIPGLTAYNVAVTVSAETTIQSAPGRSITVTVTVGGNSYSLSAYRFNYD
jgi:MSHA pilin protein MshD